MLNFSFLPIKWSILFLSVFALRIIEEPRKSSSDLTKLDWTVRCTTPEVPVIDNNLWQNEKMKVYKKFIDDQPSDACSRYS